MKYMLLIHQGTTPLPGSPEWDALSARARRSAVYAAYQARQRDARRHARAADAPPETATTVRVQDGQTLDTDGPFAEIKEALGGYCFFEADDLDAAIELAAQDPGGAHGRRDRGAPARGVVAILEQVFREQWGRVLAALIGFLGDFDLAEEAAQEAFAIAAERWPRDGVPDQPGALAGDDRAQPRDRPHPPRPHARREDAPARGARGGREDADGRDDHVPRRAARAGLHLLPPGARHRGAGRADAAHARRPDHAGDRARVPRRRADDGAAARARQAQDQGGRHPVPRAARPPAARPARRRARGRLPDLQRGLRAAARRPRRPRRCGSAARSPS